METFLTTNCGYAVTSGVVSKGDVHVKLTEISGNVSAEAGTGSSAGTITNPTSTKFIRDSLTINSGTITISGNYPATYYFMYSSTPDQFTCVVTYGDGFCQHLSFGQAERFGTWGTGVFCSGNAEDYHFGSSAGDSTNYTMLHRDGSVYCESNSGSVDADRRSGVGYGFFATHNTRSTTSTNYDVTKVNGASSMHCDAHTDGVNVSNWLGTWGMYGSPSYTNARGGQLYVYPPLTYVLNNGQNSWNNQSPLIALNIYVDTAGIELIGTFPHARFINVNNLDVGEVITVGSDQWIVFPWFKNGGSTEFSSTGTVSTATHAEYTSYFGWAVRYEP